MNDPKATDEDVRRLSDQYRGADAEIFTVTASATRELADFYEQTLLDRGLHPDRIPLGEADGFVFDLYDSREDCKAKIDAWKSPFAEDFPRVYAALKDALIKAELFAPDTSDPFRDLKISFETRDLDGNPVSSEDLFKQNTITMLNFWATWCGPCKAELRDPTHLPPGPAVFPFLSSRSACSGFRSQVIRDGLKEVLAPHIQ
ncbi:MAG: TlpA family protein disulfide reductase [Oscillospiraceae bacterium]|nr:TlpA family protein disulfide reductase [Oscillospiraceae bacterium]MBQ6612039.1 TlpA family protein disulfide reductase [Oscillospiraceae bacterium]